MARTRRRVAYRKRYQNKLSMFLVTFVVMLMLVVVAIRSAGIRQKIEVKEAYAKQLDQQIFILEMVEFMKVQENIIRKTHQQHLHSYSTYTILRT